MDNETRLQIYGELTSFMSRLSEAISEIKSLENRSRIDVQEAIDRAAVTLWDVTLEFSFVREEIIKLVEQM